MLSRSSLSSSSSQIDVDHRDAAEAELRFLAVEEGANPSSSVRKSTRNVVGSSTSSSDDNDSAEYVPEASIADDDVLML